MNTKKTSLLNILIDFFASIYDWGIASFVFLVDLFASIYDAGYNFMVFVGEYIKWITTITPRKTTDFNSLIKNPIKNNN